MDLLDPFTVVLDKFEISFLILQSRYSPHQLVNNISQKVLKCNAYLAGCRQICKIYACGDIKNNIIGLTR